MSKTKPRYLLSEMAGKPTIRLGCIGCDDAHDGITERELGGLLRLGWTEVERVQTYEESIEEITPESDQSRSVLDWETHLGYCPSCSEV